MKQAVKIILIQGVNGTFTDKKNARDPLLSKNPHRVLMIHIFKLGMM